MGSSQTRLGSIDGQGVTFLIESLFRGGWSGALRLRHARQIGSVWMVGGEAVHAVWLEGKCRLEGIPALERLTRWSEGTYLLDEGALPPERSVREDTGELLTRFRVAESAPYRRPAGSEAAATDLALETLLSTLRERVPGLESLSISSGDALEATTERDAQTRERLNRHWRALRDESGEQTETLYIRQGDRTLLVVKTGSVAAILSAQPHTSPEALLWAGMEAGRKIRSLGYDDHLVKSL